MALTPLLHTSYSSFLCLLKFLHFNVIINTQKRENVNTNVAIQVSCDQLLNYSLVKIKTKDEFLLCVMDESLILSRADDVIYYCLRLLQL